MKIYYYEFLRKMRQPWPVFLQNKDKPIDPKKKKLFWTFFLFLIIILVVFLINFFILFKNLGCLNRRYWIFRSEIAPQGYLNNHQTKKKRGEGKTKKISLKNFAEYVGKHSTVINFWLLISFMWKAEKFKCVKMFL